MTQACEQLLTLQLINLLDTALNGSYNDDIMNPNFFGGWGFHFLLTDNQFLAPPNWPLPDIGNQLDAFAKSFHSTFMVDLGSTVTANILTDPVLLQSYTNFTALGSTISGLVRPGEALESYDTIKDRLGPLLISSSTIFTDYLCQIPKRKPGLELFVSILVSDLVFMSTIWAVIKIILTWYIGHRDKKAQYCHGCIEIHKAISSVPPDEEAGSGAIPLTNYDPTQSATNSHMRRLGSRRMSAGASTSRLLVGSDDDDENAGIEPSSILGL